MMLLSFLLFLCLQAQDCEYEILECNANCERPGQGWREITPAGPGDTACADMNWAELIPPCWFQEGACPSCASIINTPLQCRVLGRNQGLSLGDPNGAYSFEVSGSSANYDGCYAYDSASITWENQIYFGTGSSNPGQRANPSLPMYRPYGYDCDFSTDRLSCQDTGLEGFGVRDGGIVAAGDEFVTKCSSACGIFASERIWGCPINEGWMTSDSAVCKAAAALGIAPGMLFTVVFGPGQSSYDSCGLPSGQAEYWDDWNLSFKILDYVRSQDKNRGMCTTAITLSGSSRVPGEMGTYQYQQMYQGRPAYQNAATSEWLFWMPSISPGQWIVADSLGSSGGVHIHSVDDVSSPDMITSFNSHLASDAWQADSITATCVTSEDICIIWGDPHVIRFFDNESPTAPAECPRCAYTPNVVNQVYFTGVRNGKTIEILADHSNSGASPPTTTSYRVKIDGVTVFEYAGLNAGCRDTARCTGPVSNSQTVYRTFVQDVTFPDFPEITISMGTQVTEWAISFNGQNGARGAGIMYDNLGGHCCGNGKCGASVGRRALMQESEPLPNLPPTAPVNGIYPTCEMQDSCCQRFGDVQFLYDACMTDSLYSCCMPDSPSFIGGPDCCQNDLALTETCSSDADCASSEMECINQICRQARGPDACQGSWSDHSECSATCGYGIQYRTYTVTQERTSSSGVPCAHEHLEVDSRECTRGRCGDVCEGLTCVSENPCEVQLGTCVDVSSQFSGGVRIAQCEYDHAPDGTLCSDSSGVCVSGVCTHREAEPISYMNIGHGVCADSTGTALPVARIEKVAVEEDCAMRCSADDACLGYRYINELCYNAYAQTALTVYTDWELQEPVSETADGVFGTTGSSGHCMKKSKEECMLVARQTMPEVWDNSMTTLNVDDPNNANYAILDSLEAYRNADGKFYFRLSWPGDATVFKWGQTSNPLIAKDVEGFEPIEIPYASTTPAFTGLRASSQALMDGNAGDMYYFYSVGAFAPWYEGIPSYISEGNDYNHPQQSVELCVLTSYIAPTIASEVATCTQATDCNSCSMQKYVVSDVTASECLSLYNGEWENDSCLAACSWGTCSASGDADLDQCVPQRYDQAGACPYPSSFSTQTCGSGIKVEVNLKMDDLDADSFESKKTALKAGLCNAWSVSESDVTLSLSESAVPTRLRARRFLEDLKSSVKAKVAATSESSATELADSISQVPETTVIAEVSDAATDAGVELTLTEVGAPEVKVSQDKDEVCGYRTIATASYCNNHHALHKGYATSTRECHALAQADPACIGGNVFMYNVKHHFDCHCCTDDGSDQTAHGGYVIFEHSCQYTLNPTESPTQPPNEGTSPAPVISSDEDKDDIDYEAGFYGVSIVLVVFIFSCLAMTYLYCSGTSASMEKDIELVLPKRDPSGVQKTMSPSFGGAGTQLQDGVSKDTVYALQQSWDNPSRSLQLQSKTSDI